ncbi:MAG: hypothetical protein MSC31_01730 [Solirubrobacteraceae bacterium MAG38_C4-C5]|nr:hypothetical protein [Candidatus Siliceabacter maunaloa]
MTGGPLVCPGCGGEHPADERFCERCALPLVFPGAGEEPDPVGERHPDLRKVKPQLSEGELVQVAGARHQPEAEMIQGILLEEGVPSTLRRTRGFDVPEMLAAGPRDVLVPRSGLETAREVLLQADLLVTSAARPTPPGRLAAALLGCVGLVGLVVWLGTEVGF